MSRVPQPEGDHSWSPECHESDRKLIERNHMARKNARPPMSRPPQPEGDHSWSPECHESDGKFTEREHTARRNARPPKSQVPQPEGDHSWSPECHESDRKFIERKHMARKNARPPMSRVLQPEGDHSWSPKDYASQGNLTEPNRGVGDDSPPRHRGVGDDPPPRHRGVGDDPPPRHRVARRRRNYILWGKKNRGGPAEIRTLDPQLARLMLYQLSYRPTIIWCAAYYGDCSTKSILQPQLFEVFGGFGGPG